MRVLLDECLPRLLAAELSGHQVSTVPEVGWAGKKNGQLLELASFITIDQFLVVQQRIAELQLAVVVLSAPSNRFEHLLPLVPRILAALEVAGPGAVVQLRHAS